MSLNNMSENRPIKKEYLESQPSAERPYVIESYPYGWLRTQKRVWIESNEGHGQRVAEQTLDPKRHVWNKVHYSTYSSLLLAYVNSENGHIEFNGLSFSYDGQTELDTLLAEYPESKLSEFQKKALVYFRAIIKTRKLVSCSIVVNPDEQKQKELAEKEKQTTEYLKRAFTHYYLEEEKKAQQIKEGASQ